jgi:hypothetical protein
LDGVAFVRGINSIIPVTGISKKPEKCKQKFLIHFKSKGD